MNGYGVFGFRVSFSYSEAKKFVECRNWFSETYGPSCEREFYSRVGDLANPHWAWELNQNLQAYIYIKDEKDADFFCLKWMEGPQR